jgi:hypothetical protein
MPLITDTRKVTGGNRYESIGTFLGGALLSWRVKVCGSGRGAKCRGLPRLRCVERRCAVVGVALQYKTMLLPSVVTLVSTSTRIKRRSNRQLVSGGYDGGGSCCCC